MTVTFRLGRREAVCLLALLLVAELLLVFAFLLEPVSAYTSWTIHRLFDLDAEDSIATWFSSTQLALAAALVGSAGLRPRTPREPATWFVALAAGVLFALSADEALQVHEAVTIWARRNDIGADTLAQQAVLLVPVAATGLLLLAVSAAQLRRTYRYHRAALCIMSGGLAVFLSGAVGVDLMAHLFLPGGGIAYRVAAALEEFIELFGGTLLLLGGGVFALRPGAEAEPVTGRRPQPAEHPAG